MKVKSSIIDKYPLLVSLKDNSLIYQKAMHEAKMASDILKLSFGAEHVYIFGSLTHPNRFTENSDVDLAVSGIPNERFYASFAAVTRIVKSFKLDLIDISDCREYIRKSIEMEGVEI